MPISDIGQNVYVSPFGGEALLKYNAGYNTKTGEYQPDKLIKHHKNNSSIGDYILGTALFLGTAFSIYKGRNHIQSAFNAVKGLCSTGWNKIKTSIASNNIGNHIKGAFNTVKGWFVSGWNSLKNGCSSIKNKISNFFN